MDERCKKAWADVKPGVKAFCLKDKMTKTQYITYYNTVYKYCVSHCNDNEATVAGFKSACRSLYDQLGDYLCSYVQRFPKLCEDKVDETLLLYYIEIWKDYCISSTAIHNLFFYLDEHWIKQELKENKDAEKSGLYEIYSMSLWCWRQFFLEQGGSGISIIRAAINQMNKERNGDTIRTELLTPIQQSYVDLGVTSSLATNQALYYYRNTLEKEVAEATTKFYQEKSHNFLEKNSVSDYLKLIKDKLREEEERVKRYLHRSSLDPIIAASRKALVEEHMDQLMEDFKEFLRQNKSSDLELMYEVVKYSREGRGRMAELLLEYITEYGRAELNKHNADEIVNDPDKYVKTILAVYKENRKLVMKIFHNDSVFMEAFDKACVKFINDNSVTKKGKGSQKSSQLLAIYCHQLLKEKNKSMEEAILEDELELILQLYVYLQEKDVFEKYYKIRLALRLVNDISASDDAETHMITKLGKKCGVEYENSLLKMLRDIRIASTTINNDFKDHIARSNQKPGVDFRVDVLTTFMWPYSNSPNVALPQELDACVQQFVNFYTVNQSGRKLQWLYDKSRGDVIARCFQRPYTLTASTYQISILMQYNHNDSYTYKELRDRTLLGENILQQLMNIFISVKLLVSPDVKGSKESDVIPDHAVFSLFKEYKNKRLRVVINKPLRFESEEQVEEKISKEIEMQRGYVIQAAITRIMKMRKTMMHYDLILEVIQQVNKKFVPTAKRIKPCIDDLIERQYLSRDPHNYTRYHYVAGTTDE